MSLISEREQIYLLNWAKAASSRMAEEVVCSESYFEERTSEETYLVEYVFDTVGNMNEMIQKVLGNGRDEKLRKVCEVAALKERSSQVEERGKDAQTMKEEQQKEESQIPEFIYNF